MVVTWPNLLEKHFTVDEMRRASFLIGDAMSDGKFYCKACAKFVSGSRSSHHAVHVVELTKWEQEREAERKEVRSEKMKSVRAARQKKPAAPKDPFYKDPCASCGNQIPRTGKRGRAPKLCVECRTK